MNGPHVVKRKTKTMNYRMMSLSTVAFALLAVSGSVFSADSPHADHLKKCALTCADCAVTCNACFDHCATLVADGKKEHAKCMRLCVDCAECCQMCSTLCARQSALSAHALLCCAKCCDECAAACEAMPDDKHMAACAKSCRNCAKECLEISKMAK